MTEIKLRVRIGQPFGASNERGTCLYCGTKLRQKYHTKKQRTGKYRKPSKCGYCGDLNLDEDDVDEHGRPYYICCLCGMSNAAKPSETVVGREPVFEAGALGDYGDNAFCTLRCGYKFGVAAARNRFRLKPKKD